MIAIPSIAMHAATAMIGTLPNAMMRDTTTTRPARTRLKVRVMLSPALVSAHVAREGLSVGRDGP
jgi:hypothetical protein